MARTQFNTGKFRKPFFSKVKDFAGKTVKKFKTRVNKANKARVDAKVKHLKNREAYYVAKAGKEAAKAKFKTESTNRRAQQGGLIGKLARDLQTKIAKGDASVEIEKKRPDIYEKSEKTRIENEAAIKRTRARGAAVSAVVAAAAKGWSDKSKADAEKAKAQAEADIKAIDAMNSSVNATPQVTTDPYANQSVSGLVTGVR